ncbi:EAL domain-containing protein [Pseudoalteromonas sp. US3C1013]|uniref:bifunctional diguanylate cyclase/phosphodiesterase n=1 Tax=unclassified Pseudoalteromonas TaxID=194690 RepID=UPI003AB82873
MALIKKNLWTLFCFLLFGGLTLLSLLLVYEWKSLKKEYRTHSQNNVALSAQSLNSSLRNKELMLDLIGRDILLENNSNKKISTIKVLNNILLKNLVSSGFVLYDTQGQIRYLSSNLDPSAFVNLKKSERTQENFAHTLKSNKMMLGRTYFNETLQEWIIPIRKALRDENAEVIAVMTSGMAISKGEKYLNILRSTQDDYLLIIRELDGYIQYSSDKNADIASYTQTKAEQSFGLLDAELVKQLGKTKQALKYSEEVFSFYTDIQGKAYITSAKFDNRYQLWILSQVAIAPIKQQFYKTVIVYCLVYLLISIVLFLGFRLINKAEQKRLMELFYLSRHDDLTKLPNRKALREHFEAQKNTPFSLAIINITNLSYMNNRFGMEYGDKAIKAFAHSLEAKFKAPFLVFRNSGNEFCIISPSKESENRPHFFESKLNLALRYYETNNNERPINICVGVSNYPDHGNTKAKLVRCAHLANQWAKDTGNWLCYYQSDIEIAYLRRVKIEERLAIALTEKTLFMAYQCQVNEQGKILAMEALVRWKDDELGMVSPAEFIAIAEQSDLIFKIGDFVLASSISEFAKMQQHSDTPLELAINISVMQFQSSAFITTLLQSIETHNVAPQSIILEITESLFMDNLEHVIDTINSLKSRGIRFSMDDFGTGYSSLSLLRRLPIDELKIDKSFVDDILIDPKSNSMVQSIIAIANSHNLSVIAEGVEEQAQFDMLVDIGCKRFQGYYFYKPVNATSVIEYLQAN